MKMKKVLALFLSGAMVMSLAACGGGSSSTATTAAATTAAEAEAEETEAAESQESGSEAAAPATSGCTVSENSDIVLIDYNDASTLYPLDLSNVTDELPAMLIYDTLVRLDGNGDYVWMLASGMDVSDDNLEYTFHLREGITFSDGNPWNAEACKANLEAMADQSHGYRAQGDYAVISNVEVVDDYTVKVTLSEVYAPFLNVLCSAAASMVSPDLLKESNEVMASSPVGTGQYILESRTVGEATVLNLNRDWWGYDAEICGGTPIVASDCGFNTITIRPVKEEATRVSLLMSGEADIVNSLTATNQTVVEAQGFNLIRESGTSMAYFYMNCSKDVFKDARVRQAISMAIDREALNNVVYGGVYLLADSPLTPAIPYYKAQAENYKVDVEAAKALLAEAGYPDGFTITCWEENDTTDIQRGEFIQQQLEQIGITMEIYPQEGGFLADNVNGYTGDPADTEFDCYIRGYGGGAGDADESLGRFASDKMPPIGGNYSFWTNEAFDAAVRAGAATTDPTERAAAYEEAQKIFWDEVPAVTLLATTYSAANNEHIEGVGFVMAGILSLGNAKYVE